MKFGPWARSWASGLMMMKKRMLMRHGPWASVQGLFRVAFEDGKKVRGLGPGPGPGPWVQGPFRLAFEEG